MTVILIVLVVAEIPTAFFNWTRPEGYSHTSAANATSFARCFFDVPTAQQHLTGCRYGDPNNTDIREWNCEALVEDHSLFFSIIARTPAFENMAVSICLLVFNFLTRAIKLSETLTAIINGKIRSALSRKLRRRIEMEYNRPEDFEWYCKRPWLAHVWPLLVTRPIAAILLILRLFVDMYSSMLSEVKFTPLPHLHAHCIELFTDLLAHYLCHVGDDSALQSQELGSCGR